MSDEEQETKRLESNSSYASLFFSANQCDASLSLKEAVADLRHIEVGLSKRLAGS